jgi:hypothetical protein
VEENIVPPSGSILKIPPPQTGMLDGNGLSDFYFIFYLFSFYS